MYRVDTNNIDFDKLVSLLNSGAVMLYPTDTIPGIGCLGNKRNAVEKLFDIKKRNLKKPVSHAFSNLEMMQNYVRIPPLIRNLEKHLPGKLTLVLPKLSNSPALFGSEENSLGCRIPDVSWLLKLISIMNTPIVTTSANLAGVTPVHSVDKIPPEILNKIDIIIEWKGELHGTGSTVIDLREDDQFTILREGAISEIEINELLMSKSRFF